MDLDFGHGFLPRIGSDNYKAVDRCLGPAQLFSDPIDLPWAVVDAAWAEPQPEVLDALRAHGTQLIADTSAWRLRFESAFEVKRLAQATWAPIRPVDVTSRDEVATLVRASLRAQAAIGAAVYLVPGFIPVDGNEDLAATYETIIATVTEFTDVDAKPYFLYLGGHTKGLELVHRLIDDLPSFLSGVYVQLSPLETTKDTPTKLERVTEIYQHVSAGGFKVIAGYAGAVTPALRALGIDAADAGLATAEAFDQSGSRRSTQSQTTDDDRQGGGPQSRMYFPTIDRSLDGKQARRLLDVPAAAAQLLGCRLPCHRFTGGDPLARAREHSLWARVDTSREISRLPATMRLQALYERTCTQRSRLTTINGALVAASQAPLDTKPLDNRLVWISRTLQASAAA